MPTDLHNFFLDEKNLSTINNVERKKFLQKLKIIKHLFLNGETSNAEVCQRFNVSLPTSMSLLNQLTEEGIVIKKGRGKSEGGRKPDLYGLIEESFFVISVHIERFRIKLAIIDNNHSIIKEKSWPTEISSETNIVELLYKWSQELLQEAEIKQDQIMGVGISMPGLVSADAGKNFTYYLSEQEPESLKLKIEKKFKKPVAILNDAKSACLAEFRYGKAKNKNNVLVISMDWGIGLGIIMGGKMHSGESGFAGEFGHIPMTEDGLLCHCGKRGCLETEASGLALVRKTKEGLKAGQTSVLNSLKKEELEKLEPETIIEAANRGDQFAIQALSEIGIKLGKGIAILIQIFNPELVILEGKIAEAKKFITTPIQQSINTYCMMQLKERTKIELSTLGAHSSLYGGTIAVMEDIFKDQVNLVKSHIS
ncbi:MULTISPECIES: ROK family transcriptional regulator [Salegentibacter]|uniref:ROK family transcriptional regulator n=1 Tax=Salegentibacter maritimus TaxID=2794347 RepID=A0ABS0THM6_9FLAO|nr:MULTISPECIES: ROK family transcriptional regulator [Salegentibacter]MBE7641621.1 ROK family protein [Salegentibacter sp. BLCTC]MBI6116133.1 ROK family transcriptional regulator [Salegentibacter maritimus]MBI6120295.1 ROK family transcriptional regulator [Salegentibacter maritimus]